MGKKKKPDLVTELTLKVYSDGTRTTNIGYDTLLDKRVVSKVLLLALEFVEPQIVAFGLEDIKPKAEA